MLAASQVYKQSMKERFRNRTYMRVSIGVINQLAQATAYISDSEHYTYYSNLTAPLNDYQVKECYATCDQDYARVDGSMFFLPREKENIALNQGIVSENLLGIIEVRFPTPYDIKGLTVDFGPAYPVDFTIESDNHAVVITKNASGQFITDEIFESATFLRFLPLTMVNGQGRLRIHQITMGIGIYFDNKRIRNTVKKEHISPVMEDLPAIDFDMTITNYNREFDIENEESTVNFLEVGQEIVVMYGQELPDSSIEWLQGATLQLREWSADDEEMKLTASDRFESMDGTYYKGTYHRDGISLYDLAIDVMEDAGIDKRTYWFDTYLKNVKVKNPMPIVPHREALQIIANAGRCILYQDRYGKLFMKSSFLPDMEASSMNETYFSHADRILDQTAKDVYTLASKDYTNVSKVQYFLPRQSSGVQYLNTGYISEETAGENGRFENNPTVEIKLEAAFKCFGFLLEFGDNAPEEMVFHSYLNGVIQEDFKSIGLSQITTINHEFPEFDHLVLEFTKGISNNRVELHNVIFGDSTDYELSYGAELTKTPKGTQLPKVKELQVMRTIYNLSEEEKELLRESIQVSPENNKYTFYFSNASYDLSVSIIGAAAGQSAIIVEHSDYFATVEFAGVTEVCEVVITGKEYRINQTKVSKQLNVSGSLETWENPLVSDASHAADLADWIGDYMKADREYDSLQYRGDPRIDANDLVFLENKYVPDLLLRVYEHTLKFNGALSGTIKARRDMSRVAAAKDRLVRK